MVYAAINPRVHDERVEQPRDCVGYAALDPLGQKIGTIERLFVNGHGEPKYLKVSVGGLFARRSVLIPVRSVVVNKEGQTLMLS